MIERKRERERESHPRECVKSINETKKKQKIEKKKKN